MIDIRTALEHALLQLGPVNPDSRLEAEILLGQVLHQNRAYLFAHPEKLISHTQLDAYQAFIAKRVQGVPIAYITGIRSFWSLSLNVNQHTLIPRHETEQLVELTLELIPNKPDIQILDLGTGSGAIALALAQERPNWQIDACDLSQDALLVAQDNAQKHQISNVNFYQSDWFNNLKPKRYHAIVSNPPYIAPQDPHLQQGDVRFEPQSALVSGQEGLADLQYLIEHSRDHLQPDGLLLLEHGYDQKLHLSAILKKLGYKNIQSWQDLQGHYRMSGGMYS
ncbi:MAG: peptide chain release factor N(5)-glutamine methyltransferase [Legionellales bacterium]